MGFAHGQLLKDQINKVLPAFYQHVEQEVKDYIHKFPKELQDIIAKYGLDGALDLTYEFTKKYIPQYFLDELKGISNGSGLDYKLLLRVHMLPELVKVSLEHHSTFMFYNSHLYIQYTTKVIQIVSRVCKYK